MLSFVLHYLNKSFKILPKPAKPPKKREADKLKDTPQYYPLQLSPSEVEYVRNTLMSAGGGVYI